MTTCPECSKPVSSEAPGCPSCGHPIKPPPAPAKKTGFWWGLGCLLAVPAFLMVVAVVGMLAAIAIPSFVKARNTSQMNACMNNMRQIDAAKEQWAVSTGAADGQPADIASANSYIKGSATPLCPAEGTYTYHDVGQDPECSVHGLLSSPREFRDQGRPR